VDFPPFPFQKKNRGLCCLQLQRGNIVPALKELEEKIVDLRHGADVTGDPGPRVHVSNKARVQRPGGLAHAMTGTTD
jgi:hypothetical protein